MEPCTRHQQGTTKSPNKGTKFKLPKELSNINECLSFFQRIVFTHIDSGSNCLIVNKLHYLIKYQPFEQPQSLTQVTGSKVPIHGIGTWPLLLHNILFVFPNVLYMPGNPVCTFSPCYLEKRLGFPAVWHKCGDLRITDHKGRTFCFTYKNGIK